MNNTKHIKSRELANKVKYPSLANLIVVLISFLVQLGWGIELDAEVVGGLMVLTSFIVGYMTPTKASEVYDENLHVETI